MGTAFSLSDPSISGQLPGSRVTGHLPLADSAFGERLSSTTLRVSGDLTSPAISTDGAPGGVWWCGGLSPGVSPGCGEGCHPLPEWELDESNRPAREGRDCIRTVGLGDTLLIAPVVMDQKMGSIHRDGTCTRPCPGRCTRPSRTRSAGRCLCQPSGQLGFVHCAETSRSWSQF